MSSRVTLEATGNPIDRVLLRKATNCIGSKNTSQTVCKSNGNGAKSSGEHTANKRRVTQIQKS